MQVSEIAKEECRSVLAHASFGRLGCCLDDQPYIVPINFAFDNGYLYAISTLGQKIVWMRRNPKVCVLVDKITSESKWVSVVVNGSYQELTEPQFTEERKLARQLLQTRAHWWQAAFAERQAKSEDELIDALFFRVHVDSLSGLRAVD